MPAPIWLPNWRTIADYPDPNLPRDTIACWRWRWEFLRRNHDYQRDWQRFTNTDLSKDERLILIRRYCVSLLVDPAATKSPTFFKPRLYCFSPRGKGDKQYTINLPEGRALVEFDLDEIEESLDAQLESARWQLIPWLSRKYETLPRHGKGYQWLPDQWLKYLRILDANETGAELAEIGEILYPGASSRRVSQSYYDDWRRASELRDGGYRRLR